MKNKNLIYLILFFVILVSFASGRYLTLFFENEDKINQDTDNIIIEKNFVPGRIFFVDGIIKSINNREDLDGVEILVEIDLSHNFINFSEKKELDSFLVHRQFLVTEETQIIVDGGSWRSWEEESADISVLKEGDMFIAMLNEPIIEILNKNNFKVLVLDIK